MLEEQLKKINENLEKLLQLKKLEIKAYWFANIENDGEIESISVKKVAELLDTI